MTRPSLGLAVLLCALPVPALAQKATPEARLDRVEKELKAVQRKVFPGGSPAFFEPEIAAQAPAAAAGQPAGAPLNDLTARIDGLEREVARLTGQLEQDEHRLTLLSEQAARDRGDYDARLKALELPTRAAAATAPTMAEDLVAPAPKPATPVKGVGKPTTAPAPTKPSAMAPRAITEVAPAAAATGDPGEDAYMTGYRLWAAKKYPEAATALKAMVAKYPKHKRASYAQNLLGRALLDDDHPASAAEAFAANYQTNPRGERAPDSLYYLGASLMTLKKPADACKVYDEFDAAYGATAEAALKDRVVAARKTAKCK